MHPEPKVDDPFAEVRLAQRIAGGDTQAFEALVRRHTPMLFRAARAILRDDAEAEDALHDAWLSAYRSMGQFRGDATLSAWLARIAANAARARRLPRRTAAAG